MDVTAATSATATTTTSAESTSQADTLDYDDFLNLLVVQLQNQDPLEPTSNTDFIAQMANFSTLNEVSNFSDNFSTYSSRQQQISSQTFLGKDVTVTPDNGGSVTGTVSAVTYDSDGSIYVTINGSQYDAANIVSTTESTAQ